MKNFYRRGMLIIMFLLALGLIVIFSLSQAKASTPSFNLPLSFQQEITGKVTGPDGQPLSGVTVILKNKGTGVTTNINGNYSISAGPGDILIFSSIGYRRQEIPVNSQSTINVSLQEEVASLDEVQINAGYYNVTERERTGNISRVTAEEIENQPVINPLAAIQGRMPGVQVTQNTGVPGGGFDIKIRGTNSLRSDGNQPLFIVDGVPYTSTTLGDRNLYAFITWQGQSPISLLNPNDIESIEVLKDADATAIYGSRGANGVILITTKKGSAGKVRIGVNASTGVGNVSRKMNLMNTSQYLEARREAYANDGITEYPFFAYDVNGTWEEDRYTDWQEELIGGTAETYNLRANVSGGSDQTNFLLSTGYLRQTTVFPGDYHYGKGSVHMNIAHEAKDGRFSFNFSGTYSSDNNFQPSTDFTREALSLSPNAPAIYNEDGSLNWANSSWNNPLRNEESIYESKTDGLISNLTFGYEILEGLKFKSSFGFTRLDFDELKTTPSTVYNPAYGITSASSIAFFNKASNQSWIIEPQFTYDKSLGNHELKLLLGATFQEDASEKFVQLGAGFPSNNLITNLSAASNSYLLNNDKNKYRYNAIFGRFNYKYQDRYIVNLTGRRDGSSRFGPGKRFSNFGAIGIAWLFGKENFFSNTWLSFGKLRSSYGITGNDQIGDYQYLDTYSITSNLYNGSTGLAPSRLFNPDFSWESNRKLEFGFELGFFEDRIFTSASYYLNRSSNQLVGIPLAGTTGFSSIQANLDATVENRGWEFELRTQNFQNDHFSWSTSFNLSIPENELIEFPGLEASTYANQYIIGEPLDIRRAYKFEGIEANTGIYSFMDYNGDGIISSTEDRETIVRFNTQYFGGLDNNLKWNSFDLNFSFQYAYQYGYNFFLTTGYPIAISNQPVEVLDRWQQVGDEARFQMFTTGSDPDAVLAYNRLAGSDASVTNASYIRLKNVALGYQIPDIGLKNLTGRIYLQGQNLLTFTNYMGLDPETRLANRIPPLRIISAGIDVSF